MSDWKFKTAKGEPVDQSKMHLYVKALETAAQSRVSDPKFSRYFCKESIGYRKMHEAGNVEYGLCQALHGEESAVAALRASLSEPVGLDEHLIMGIIADDSEGDRPANPCGNCRDIMLDAFGLDLEIVSGPANGGMAVVAKLSDYLFSSYQPVNLREEWLNLFRPDIFDISCRGERCAFDGYSPADVHPERRYYARITGRAGSYIGALDLMCDYHPIYPLRDAIRQARRVGDLYFGPVFIVGQDTSEEFINIPPHVMYKDRQHLMELNLGQELLKDNEYDPSVVLVRLLKETSSETRIGRVWRTSVKEWLPLPFSPRNFGPEFVSGFTQYLKTRLT